MSRYLHLYWSRGGHAKTQVTYDLDADILGIGGDVVETVLRLIPHSAVYNLRREAGLAEPAAGGTALLRHHLPLVSFFTTDHYHDPQETIDLQPRARTHHPPRPHRHQPCLRHQDRDTGDSRGRTPGSARNRPRRRRHHRHQTMRRTNRPNQGRNQQ